MMDHEIDENDVEGVVLERQLLRIGFDKRNIRMQCPRRLDHRGNQINAGHGGAGVSHHRRDMSRTTADLEGPAVARQVRRVEQVAHRLGRQLRGVLRVDGR